MEGSINEHINRCLTGDQAAFREVVNRYRSRMIRLAYRYVHDWEEAADISQDAFLRAYSALAGFDQSKKFDAWLMRIVVNLSLDRLRHTATVRTRQADIHRMLPGRKENPELAAVGGEQLCRLHELMDELNERQRTVFVLRELEGLDYHAIARLLGCSPATVRVHLFTAKRRLRMGLATVSPIEEGIG
ncbi:sigma-70 family RNA polymerase sigma factor [bacterium]|nr:sigma-70 family RNA polymerase sigma factor [candidate division CSSED10-310 bacterium]